jgi:hypothetical protein
MCYISAVQWGSQNLMCLSNTSNVASITKKLNCESYPTLTNLNINIQIWLWSTVLDSTMLQFRPEWTKRNARQATNLSHVRNFKCSFACFSCPSADPPHGAGPTSTKVSRCCQVGKIVQTDDVNDGTHYTGVVLGEET